ncbi:MAG: hypothetical protein KGI00_03025 [Candidatus Micrarchaeota archaeon]|nr:hypothetical protein [Candidatus Micrarchaeota archaeon]MDE1824387.1 hypothetical protein [Candidatus Micrarchaeota archaeon]MDE1849679.1 hypothetical protein [Candidatus Micrarchaeota archaeon]
MQKGKLPAKVAAALEGLRGSRKAYVEVKYRKANAYYAFEATSRFDKGKGKPVKVTKYIGRILENGSFVEAKHRSESFVDYMSRFVPDSIKRELASVRMAHEGARIASIDDNGFQVYGSENGRERFLGTILENGAFAPAESEAQPAERMSSTREDELLLTALSMNARMPFSRLAELSGLNGQAAYSHVKSLEKRLGIGYMLEIDASRLKYMPFIILIKFEGERPSIDKFREFFAGEPKIQFAALTSGDYDVIAYMLEEDNFKAGETIWRLRNQSHMRVYRAVWYVSLFSQTYGYVPLREEFIDKVLRQRVWSRTKERPKPAEGELLKREFILLKEMNDNGNMDFTAIDAKHGLGRGSSQYTYHKLLQKGIIKRATIRMKNLPIRYSLATMIAFNNVSEFDETRMKLLKQIISYNGLYSRFALAGDMGTPSGGFLLSSVLDYEEPAMFIDYVRENVKGIRLSELIVTDVMIGTLCYRRYDMAQTTQYPKLLARKEIEPVKTLEYG